jgi:hypothetical protein
MGNVKPTKKLEILKKSLVKKEKLFEEKLQCHFETVAQANGQPLNDKRNGRATIKKWDRQNDSLHNLKESIKKTENAIEREEGRIYAGDACYATMPKIMTDMIDNGTLTQWRRHPNTMFVKGVDKARIIWDEKKQTIFYKYAANIPDQTQFAIFKQVFNDLHAGISQKR